MLIGKDKVLISRKHMNFNHAVNRPGRDEGPQPRSIRVEQYFQATEPRDAGREGVMWPYGDLPQV